jgi:hypothetical protein
MYLFSLVFILLTVLGLFAEIVGLQNSRFAAMRTGGAQQLVEWHGGVVQAGRYSVGGGQVFNQPGNRWGGLAPCTLLATGQALAVGMPAACPDAAGANPARLDNLVIAAAAPPNPVNLLPTNYDPAIRLNTIIFTDAGGSSTRVAVTFIGPDAAANADTPLAPLGMSTSQLYRQLLRLNVDKFSFGYVTGNLLQPAARPDAAVSGAYTLPPALVFNAATNPTGPLRPGALALFTPL